MNKVFTKVMIIAAAVVAMSLTACGKAEEKTNDSKPAAQAVVSDEIVTDAETTDADDETTTEEETVTAEETADSVIAD
jgi:predicted outer membrane protein